MVARRELHPISVEEWRTLTRTHSGGKYEYIDGYII
jgi:hypothetical protein